MKQVKTLTPVHIKTGDSLTLFKQGVDDMLSKRSYFISQVLPKLKENQDYYIIKGRKSLAKGGAEKLSSIYGLIATFERDGNAIEMLNGVKGLVAYVCTLKRDNDVVGQGRGADTLDRNGNDPNKTIKMAQKRAYVDAVIRTTGLSDIFTQDLEDMNSGDMEAEDYGDNLFVQCIDESEREARDDFSEGITERQKNFLTELIFQKIDDEDERERRLGEIACLSKSDAHENISRLLNAESLIN